MPVIGSVVQRLTYSRTEPKLSVGAALQLQKLGRKSSPKQERVRRLFKKEKWKSFFPKTSAWRMMFINCIKSLSEVSHASISMKSYFAI